MENMRKLKVLISGGGTGGHIFPAIAIAKAIEKQYSYVDFLFVGAKDRMEMDKVPSEGYKIIGLWISGLQRGFDKKNLVFPFKVIHSVLKAKRIIKDFKPNLAIGTGGYASAPLIYSAARSGVPSLIQEQNSYPGISNKILGRFVDKICVAYDHMEKFFPSAKIESTGNPIRKDILGFEKKRKVAQKLFQINKFKPTILVIGGSLGALTINNAIADNIKQFNVIGVNIIWQTGTSFQDKALKCVTTLNVKGINTYPFIKEMDKAYAAADIIISRAGAIAIAEISMLSKASILIPSPYVAENHQTINAMYLKENDACEFMAEQQLMSKEFVTKILSFKSDKLREKIGKNAHNLFKYDAANNIAKLILEDCVC